MGVASGLEEPVEEGAAVGPVDSDVAGEVSEGHRRLAGEAGDAVGLLLRGDCFQLVGGVGWGEKEKREEEEEERGRRRRRRRKRHAVELSNRSGRTGEFIVVSDLQHALNSRDG